MRAIVDPDVCTGCELCTQTCPEIFKMENDKAVAYVHPVPPESIESCRQAAADCPLEAIKIEE